MYDHYAINKKDMFCKLFLSQSEWWSRLEGGSSFWVCEFKVNLFSSTFTWYSSTIYLVCFSNF